MASVTLPNALENPIMNRLWHLTPQQRILYGLCAIASYLALVASLRFQRRRALHRRFPYNTRESMGRMTDHDAWAIQKTILQMEFPFIVLKSLQFALFRVSPHCLSLPPIN